MSTLLPRDVLKKRLLAYLSKNMTDERLAWLATIFLDGVYRDAGGGVFERRLNG